MGHGKEKAPTAHNEESQADEERFGVSATEITHGDTTDDVSDVIELHYSAQSGRGKVESAFNS